MTFGVPRLNREKIELQRKLEEYKDEYEHMLDVEMPRWSYTYEEWNNRIHRKLQLKQLIKDTLMKLSEM